MCWKLAMKSSRKSPRSRKQTYDEAAEPRHLRFECDADGKVSFVEDKPPGYPAVGEPISDDIATFALRHRRVDIVVRYLRERPTRFNLTLADMLEAAPGS